MNKKLKQSSEDTIYKITKSLSAFTPITSFLAEFITPPIERRRDKWIESIAHSLSELEKRVDRISLDELIHNEEFISSLIHTSQIAFRNHQKEKLEALSNVILNEALSIDPDYDTRFIFLNYIDSLTPSHLKLLIFLNDPYQWVQDKTIRIPPNWHACVKRQIIELSIPEFKHNHNFYTQLARDLYSKGLITSDNFTKTQKLRSQLDSSTTEMGKNFITYITKPKIL